MKPRHLLILAALACMAWSLTSCTTVTLPDGTTTTGPAPGSIEAGVEVIHIIAADK